MAPRGYITCRESLGKQGLRQWKMRRQGEQDMVTEALVVFEFLNDRFVAAECKIKLMFFQKVYQPVRARFLHADMDVREAARELRDIGREQVRIHIVRPAKTDIPAHEAVQVIDLLFHFLLEEHFFLDIGNIHLTHRRQRERTLAAVEERGSDGLLYFPDGNAQSRLCDKERFRCFRKAAIDIDLIYVFFLQLYNINLLYESISMIKLII